MTLFADLSPYTYLQEQTPSDWRTLNVGWLDDGAAFPTGDVDVAVVERVWTHCRLDVHLTRGWHTCAVCPEGSREFLEVTRCGETLKLGAAEIRVFGEGKTVYATPNLLFHYITAHRYLPPKPFLEAVLTGPVPPSEAYFALLQELGVPYSLPITPEQEAKLAELDKLQAAKWEAMQKKLASPRNTKQRKKRDGTSS
jgi:hypothetical protein